MTKPWLTIQLLHLIKNTIMASLSAETSRLKRLQKVEGFKNKCNDLIIYSTNSDIKSKGQVIFFGGDVQDYPENMASHRDNKRYCCWNLESTAFLLHEKFPDHNIVVIKPVRMHLKTFSCFQNFVNGDDIGSPKHELSLDCLAHLKSLLENTAIAEKIECGPDVVLVGFSKGCVVLNQVLYTLLSLKMTPDKELSLFSENIKYMYWLDGGHSGGSDTWVTHKEVLRNLANTNIKIRIHVSPYQMERDARPWVPREEKRFRETLKQFSADIQRTLHFKDKQATLESHFEILQAFMPD